MLSIEHLSRLGFRISAPLLDSIVKKLSSIRTIHDFLLARENKRLLKVGALRKILVVGGINIGDAVVTQPFIFPLKKFFPESEISFLYQKKAYPLIRANPNIDRHFPLIRNTGYPSKRDVRSLKNLIREKNFDVIFNFCPYFSSGDFRPTRAPVIYPTRMIANVIEAYTSNNNLAQILFQMSRFSHELIEKLFPGVCQKPSSRTNFSNNVIYTTQKQKQIAENILKKLRVDLDAKKIMFNPDTSCSYTFIPFEFQVELLKGILSNDRLTVLLSCGFHFSDIEKELLKALPAAMRKRVVIIPKDTPIDVFGGVIDFSQMFITGDTAPLHVAAAKRVIVDSQDQFRNSTAVVEIFGATSGKIYGYDSFSDGFLSAAQNVPSKVFEAFPKCKNLTCIDKIFKACPEVRCFDGLKPGPIVDYIQGYMF
jgi:ADP-heptose:LPS heptosyltransferase